MASDLLDIQDLTLYFKDKAPETAVVGPLSLSLRQGEVLALLGESGCGKSLTALSLLRILPPVVHLKSSSQIQFQQQNLSHLSEAEMRTIRGHSIAMIFQDPMTALNPVLTVGRQINEVLAQHFDLSRAKCYQRCIDLLTAVGIPEPARCYAAYPHELSGGMRQRVIIAMALAGEPQILIADEPTTALDVTIQAQILNLLHTLQRKQQQSLFLISHDLGVIRQMADRVAVMYAGQIIELASSDDFFKHPLHPYSQKLFHAVPTIAQKDRTLAVIKGQVPEVGEWPPACRFADRCPKAWDLCWEKAPILYHAGTQHVRCHLYRDQATQVKVEAEITHATRKPIAHNSQHPLLSVKDLSVYFSQRQGLLRRKQRTIHAVDDVSLEVYAGETLALVGESGCGKTTLAHAILQLIQPTHGDVCFEQRSLLSLTSRQLKAYRQKIQIIFQDPYTSMNPRLMVYDILAEGVRALSPKITDDALTEMLRQLLKNIGLPETALWHYPHEFSGGQRQRICIARALAVKPQIILCDEPTSALDVSVQAQILNLLKQLQVAHGLAYLFISHNMSVVGYMADRIAVMYLGRIVEEGATDDILRHPQHPYTQKLLASVPDINRKNIISTEVANHTLASPLNPPQGCHFNSRCPKANEQCRKQYPDITVINETHWVRCWYAKES